ncbi:MAG: tetratricopeptide repeat protein [Patescibacteria group bacterium]|jgi:hypothetical protein
MFKELKTEKFLKIFIFTGLLFLVLIIFSQKIEFTSIDLGRHLENGKIIWQNPQVLFTNFYSYTETNNFFINHHWLSGVIFYGFYLIGGYQLLSLFNILLALAIFGLTFNLARKKTGFYLSGFLSLPVIFLLSERVEIRPEAFSYLFIILTWSIITSVAADKNFRRLNWLIPLFLFWVNLHIYFFIGLVLVGFQAMAEFLPPFFRNADNLKSRLLAGWLAARLWIKRLVILIFVCLLNPNTWRGLFYPFNILHNYGYEIAENKTIFYLGHLMINYNFFIFKSLLFLMVFSLIADFLITKKLRLFSLFSIVFFSVLGLFAARNLALFGLISLVLISDNLVSLKDFFLSRPPLIKLVSRRPIRLYLAGILLLLIVSSFFYLIASASYSSSFFKRPLGLDLNDGSADSVKFFKDNHLSGPIFNNYDIGSALIFWLYPQEKVFVDNRPEAYSEKFFKDIYKPLQTDPALWRTVSAKYNFKTIYFSHTDSTPWARQFLSFILTDENWSLVYFDRYAVILVNKKLTDPAIVKKLALDNLAFRDRLRVLAAAADLRGKFNLASLAEENGQTDLAQSIYQDILFVYPGNQQALVALGSLYAGSQSNIDLQIALTYFNRARESGYRLPGIYNQIALVYWRLNNYQKAEDAWRSALDLDKNDSTALYYLQQIKSLRLEGRLPLVK